jgi:hypothetical protein
MCIKLNLIVKIEPNLTTEDIKYIGICGAKEKL